MLPYELNSEAMFDFAGFNGRLRGDDVMDIMITLASNAVLADVVAPNRVRIRSDFPYLGPAFTAHDQAKMRAQKPIPKNENRP